MQLDVIIILHKYILQLQTLNYGMSNSDCRLCIPGPQEIVSIQSQYTFLP